MRILANDGLEGSAISKLEAAGHVVSVVHIPADELLNTINEFDVLTVRSATKVRKNLIDNINNTKLIIRAGVGMDNIDVSYALEKGIAVRNTPLASSLSVAELTIAHLFGCVRFLPQSNRQMPIEGTTSFKKLKEIFSKGSELKGKTLGIIGFGNIAIETAKIALGLGMNVVAYNRTPKKVDLQLSLGNNIMAQTRIQTISKEQVLECSDFICIHSSGSEKVLFNEDYEQMKAGVGIINCARGGVIDEAELLTHLNSGKISFAGIDVFEEEPTNNLELLSHPKVSLTPHIGASTIEAQKRVGDEVADIILNFSI